ncbi:hypothetical protein KSF_057900 [Reticulibacter mediterranei]|uniref:Uncharacterized protein n=1 Tax=Reticulibacter mediterranei TaxID=2778369 RepID=A0A8J3IRW4_9CHLR|nr:hypothetical protein KSF_057900 [Reticulibacter mediterranei]
MCADNMNVAHVLYHSFAKMKKTGKYYWRVLDGASSHLLNKDVARPMSCDRRDWDNSSLFG